MRGTIKPATWHLYDQVIHCHILPMLAELKVRQLDRGRLKLLLAEKRKDRARGTVGLIKAVLSSMCSAAVDDHLLLGNPASKLGRSLRLQQPAAVRQEKIKAFTREQRDRFLAAAARVVWRYWALFFVLSRTGPRIGEALALACDDLDLEARQLRVRRGISDRKLEETLKDGPRTVDLSRQTVDVLRRLLVERKAEALRHGWGRSRTGSSAMSTASSSCMNAHGTPSSGLPARQACCAISRPTACGTATRRSS